MGIKQQLHITNFAARVGRSQARNIAIASSTFVVQLARSDRGHLIIRNYLSRFGQCV